MSSQTPIKVTQKEVNTRFMWVFQIWVGGSCLERNNFPQLAWKEWNLVANCCSGLKCTYSHYFKANAHVSGILLLFYKIYSLQESPLDSQKTITFCFVLPFTSHLQQLLHNNGTLGKMPATIKNETYNFIGVQQQLSDATIITAALEPFYQHCDRQTIEN